MQSSIQKTSTGGKSVAYSCSITDNSNKEWTCTLHLVDSSMLGTDLVKVICFAKKDYFLPIVQVGSVVVIKNAKVPIVSLSGNRALISTSRGVGLEPLSTLWDITTDFNGPSTSMEPWSIDLFLGIATLHSKSVLVKYLHRFSKVQTRHYFVTAHNKRLGGLHPIELLCLPPVYQAPFFLSKTPIPPFPLVDIFIVWSRYTIDLY